MAYNFQDFQISGGPGWIKSERFDIEAKAEGNPSRRQIEGPMLQALLKDRFQLKLHRETKELPVFGLVAAKGGLRLKPTNLEGNCAALYEMAKCADIRKGLFTLDVTAIRMDVFIEVLSSIVGRVVIDRTGFQGMFDAHFSVYPRRYCIRRTSRLGRGVRRQQGWTRRGRPDARSPIYLHRATRAIGPQA
jgi:uncharacterized protein (TIGR03435 family)